MEGMKKIAQPMEVMEKVFSFFGAAR